MFKTVNNGKLPTRGSRYSACVDLYANEDITIRAGETKLVPLGVAIDMNRLVQENKDSFEMNFYEADEHGDDGTHHAICGEKVVHFLKTHYLQLMLENSMSKHLIIANGAGVINLDCKDEIKIRLHNPISKYSKVHALANDWSGGNELNFIGGHTIKKGDRIAQITLLEHKSYLFGIETEDERTGGFGSTDKDRI